MWNVSAVDYKKWQLEPYKKHDANEPYVPPEVPFGGNSTMKTDYVPYDERPVKPLKPEDRVTRSTEPFADLTDYKESYIKHPLESRKPKERQPWQPTGVPLEGMTTFKRDYTQKPFDKNPSCKPSNAIYTSNGPFDDVTTNKTDYRQWPLDRPPLHKGDEYMKPDSPFEGNTTYNADFTQQPYAKVPLQRPTERPRKLGPFQSSTDYRENYIPYQADRVRPIQRKDDYQPSSAPFEGLSTFRSHYVPHPLQGTRPFKPTTTAARGEGPFDEATTYKVDYVPHPMDPCPAALLDTPRSPYVYKEQQPTGHKFYSSGGIAVGQPMPVPAVA